MAEQFHADLNIIQSTPIELELLDGDLNIIQQLDDEPNDVGGLTSAELKAKFDEAGNTIKQYINETLIPAVLAADATEETRLAAEAARVLAENERLAAEDIRIAAEAARAGAEAERLRAESERLPAEEARIQAEIARAAAESRRAGDEQARRGAEAERITAEAARAAAEQARRSAEAIRAANELLRISGEADRVQAESAREVWEPFDDAKTYVPGNKVSYAGGSYLCKLECAGIAPTDPVPEGGAACWLCIAKPGSDGDGSGDMLQSIYDPTERNQDVFAYTDEQIGKLRRVYDPTERNRDVFAYTDGQIGQVNRLPAETADALGLRAEDPVINDALAKIASDLRVVPRLGSTGLLSTAVLPTVPLTRGGTGQASAAAALYALLNGATALASDGLATGDYVGIGDVSSAAGKKVTLQDLAAYLQQSVKGAMIETGSYIGTGTCGPDNPNSITFSFAPKIVIMVVNVLLSQNRVDWIFCGRVNDAYSHVMYSDVLSEEYRARAGFHSSSYVSGQGKKSSDGKTFYWYDGGSNASAGGQYNASTFEYFWIALG